MVRIQKLVFFRVLESFNSYINPQNSYTPPVYAGWRDGGSDEFVFVGRMGGWMGGRDGFSWQFVLTALRLFLAGVEVTCQHLTGLRPRKFTEKIFFEGFGA